MLPCQTNCPHYCQGCHKSCAAWRELQRHQHEEQQRKKEYLRSANEACRQMLHIYWQAGGYLGPQMGH